jgi:hypothetical protein
VLIVTDFNTITDVRLVNVDTGATFMGPADPTADGINGATATTVQAIPLNDDVVIDTGEVVTLSIQADVESTALAGVKYNFELDIDNLAPNGTTLTIEGVESGEGNASYTIKPSSNPTTKAYTIAAPSITFTQKSLNNDTYVKDAEDVVVWQGTVRANDVEDLVIRSLTYIQKVRQLLPKRY